MHFHLSANAAKDFGVSDFIPAHGDHDEFSQHWYVHRVLIDRRKCIIVMEAHTRYTLIFCGATKPFFNKFPQLLADSLWRHIVALCAVPAGHYDRIRDKAAKMCAGIEYHKGLNKSVQSHIKDVAHELDWQIHQNGFPVNPGAEFYYATKCNQTFRSRYGEKQYIIPLVEFQRQWCERLGVSPLEGWSFHSMPPLSFLCKIFDMPRPGSAS